MSRGGRRLDLPWVLAVCLLGWVALAMATAADKSGVGLEKISLPSGPGSIEGLGDSFEPQLNSGTSTYSVKIAGPPGVAGLQPDLVLRYNSGGGNGHFGIAWTAGTLAIQRQTEKGLPRYGPEDTFTLGGEELVPLSDGSYRTENESAFQRIVREGSGWVVYAKNGTRSFLGSKPMAQNPSRLVRPGDGETFDDTFKWCVDEVIDVHGNRMEYRYTRFADSPGDSYCAEIRYSIFGPNYHAIQLVYERRPDAFSSFLSGFEIRTGRRCQRIEVRSQGNLVRRYAFGYELPPNDPVEILAPNDAGLAFSHLRQVTQYDNRPNSDDFLPPLRLGYTRLDVAQVQRGTVSNAPLASLGDPNLTLTDINADGLPDLYRTDPYSGQHSVYYNEGQGIFSEETLFSGFPSGFTLSHPGSQLIDFDGDARIDLVQKAGGARDHFVYFPNTTRPAGHDESRPTWGGERNFATPFPPFELSDPNVRTLDLNNDKRIDFMRTTASGFVYYYNRGDFWEQDGLYLFGESPLPDIRYADDLFFADASGQSNPRVKLADMNGDRLLDLVHVHVFENQLQLLYWPNQGRGQWGARRTLSGEIDLGVVPLEDVFIRDVNQDGLSDVLAVAYDHVSFWINQGNDRVSRRFEVANTPEYIKGRTVLQQADINGNGSTDLLWENWDPRRGGYRIDWVDLMGAEKPNLLKVIDNGIGLQTRIDYCSSTDFYVSAWHGANPWTTRLPFPTWCVSKITQTFGLDLDALPGIDTYVTEFAYHDGYYDPFEKEFRGFAFAKKVERGDDRLTDGGPAPEINSPSTLTRMAFHTGLPDNFDNDGDNRTDEFDPVGGYEEEALKGKVLWTEVCLLGPEFDGVDSDGDGFIDESDEGSFAGRPSPNTVVFSRSFNDWQLKTIHDPDGGFAELPFRTLSGQKVSFPFVARSENELVEAVGALHPSTTYPSGPVKTRSETEVDFFGNPLVQRNFGVVAGGPLTYDDERFTTTRYGFNFGKWLVGLPVEVEVTDEHGIFVSKARTLYDGLPLGQIGDRGLATRQEQFVGTSGVALEDHTPHPGDPRVAANARVTTETLYDAFGNPVEVRDPLYGAQPGHRRTFVFDPVFHTYVEEERIDTGGPGGVLVATADYDRGGGVITRSTDFNGNATTYQYDSFFRIVGIVKPLDTEGAPTQVFEYAPGDPLRSLDYRYDRMGNLTLSVSAESPVVSRVTVRSRETAGGGTFDIVQITDGAGHKLGTIEEGETPGQFVYKDVKRYTSRGHERDSYLPFFAGAPEFRAPPPDGDRVTCFLDALGRKVSCLNPPETQGGPRTRTRTDYLPLVTVLFDEEDHAPASLHADTPHVQYQDGLERLVGVDEINLRGVDTGIHQTRYDYDLQDNLVRITDSMANRKWMRHDGLGRMIFMEDPDRGKMFYTYDAASNLVTTVDAKGQRIDYTYDGANRILTEDYLDAADLTPDVSYAYDQAFTVPNGKGDTDTSAQVRGQLTRVIDLSGEEHLSYDARGRTAWKIKRIPDPENGVLISFQNTYTYDSLDRLVRLGYPDLDYVDHTYNARNLPEAIVGGPSGTLITSIDYIASGQMSRIAYGNGVVTTYDYDPRLRLSDLDTDSPTDGKLIDYAYTFDGASNITRIDDGRSGVPDERENTQVFQYDDLYRLTRVDYPVTAGHIAYSYDRIGNMLSKTSNIEHLEKGLSVTHLGAMSYGGTAGRTGRQGRDGNQPGPHALTGVSEGARVYPYDANGNMENIDGLQCTWDFKDRLVAVENTEMRAEYTYDYTDRRITKKVAPKEEGALVPSKTTHVLYPDRTFELREHAAPIKYVWNGETRVARVTANLNTNQRVQRFAVHEGHNILAVAVTVDDALSQLEVGPVTAVFRYDPETKEYLALAAGETLPAGTLVTVEASGKGTLELRGDYTPPAGPVAYPAGSSWVGNPGLQPLEVASAFPVEASLWFFDSKAQEWKLRYVDEIASASEAPECLEAGEAVLVRSSTVFDLEVLNPALGVRYYHQDHLGSSDVLSDDVGELLSSSFYYPFGNLRNIYSPKNVSSAYGFIQKEIDLESGLRYIEARYIIGHLGRFASVDPDAFMPKSSYNSDQRNTYLYSGGAPITYLDKNGQSRVKSISVSASGGAVKVFGQSLITSVEVLVMAYPHVSKINDLEKQKQQLSKRLNYNKTALKPTVEKLKREIAASEEMVTVWKGEWKRLVRKYGMKKMLDMGFDGRDQARFRREASRERSNLKVLKRQLYDLTEGLENRIKSLELQQRQEYLKFRSRAETKANEIFENNPYIGTHNFLNPENKIEMKLPELPGGTSAD